MKISLLVGETYSLGFGKNRIIYAGMTSEKVYSIAVLKWEFFYRGFAWNLFFPVEKRKIRIDGVNINVESVNAEELGIEIE